MKRTTLVGLFVGVLSLSMNAQFIQPSSSGTQKASYDVPRQNDPQSSIQELVARYQSLGKQSGAISDFFSKEEQRALQNYFRSQKMVPLKDVLGLGQSTSSGRTSVELPAAYNQPSSAVMEVAEGRTVTSSFNPQVFVPSTALYGSSRSNLTNDLLFDSGPHYNVEGPPKVSLLQDTSLGMATYGFACNPSGPYTVADDFTLTDDAEISSIDLYAYQTGSPANTINQVFIRIWDGDPSGSGAVVWGDMTTNLQTETVSSQAFRQLESAPGGTTREIQKVTASTPGLSLDAGNYWLEFMFAGTGSSGPWATPIVITGNATTGNAIQSNAGAWTSLVDVGPQGMPFQIYGTYSGGGGGGGGDLCSQSNPENNFENAGTTSKNQNQIIATDIHVPADTDFSLEKITVNIWGAPGSTINSADIKFYNNSGGLPGTEIASQMAVVPTSQTVIGNNLGFDIKETVFEITPQMLEGTAGSTNVYWVSLYVEMSSGSGYIGMTSASIVGFEHAYSPDAGVTWATNTGYDSVYLFEGECTTGGGNPPGPLTTVYGVNNADQDLIGFSVTDATNAEVFGTSAVTVNFENAGAIDPANPTTGYVLDNMGQFYSFDVTTGFYTLLGNIPGGWLGMEFDQNSGILYAIKDTSLYTIDPTAITSTLVGAMSLPAGALPIALAIDGSGMGYVHEIVTDKLYSVNLATAAATEIGSTGFDANFGQGMCYDPTTDMIYMSAFNNTTFMAEWRSVNTTTGMTTLISPITTVNDSDPQVGWSSVGETLAPPACPKPTALTVTNITETTADLSWTAEPNASNGYIWYVFAQGDNPMTDTPVATGTTAAGTTNATVSGLENAHSYDFYVVADCAGDGLSAYAGPVSFDTMITPPACGGKFYDSGGPNGNYSNNENTTTVISPDNPGDFVTVTFTSFHVEPNWDALYVYDGPDTTYPLISSGNPATNSGFPAGGYYGTSLPGPFSSTDPSGALTFVFRSESSVNYSGWEADVTCAMFPPPNDKIANSIDVGAIGFPYTDPAVRMPAATTEDGNPQDCDLTGANGVWYHFTTTGAGTANASIVTPGGVSNVTFFTAPGPNAVETDLARVQQSSNPCNPGTSSSITTEAGQTYYVFVMNTDAVTDIQIDVQTLGVEDNAFEGFSFYPNPSDGILNLSNNKVIDQVEIYNVLGQRVLYKVIDSSSASMDISFLQTGSYILKVTADNEIGSFIMLKR